MVICLERGADLHTAQLMPLPLTVSRFSKIQTAFTFLVPAHPDSPGTRAVKQVPVCVSVVVGVARLGSHSSDLNVLPVDKLLPVDVIHRLLCATAVAVADAVVRRRLVVLRRCRPVPRFDGAHHVRPVIGCGGSGERFRLGRRNAAAAAEGFVVFLEVDVRVDVAQQRQHRRIQQAGDEDNHVQRQKTASAVDPVAAPPATVNFELRLRLRTSTTAYRSVCRCLLHPVVVLPTTVECDLDDLAL